MDAHRASHRATFGSVTQPLGSPNEYPVGFRQGDWFDARSWAWVGPRNPRPDGPRDITRMATRDTFRAALSHMKGRTEPVTAATLCDMLVACLAIFERLNESGGGVQPVGGGGVGPDCDDRHTIHQRLGHAMRPWLTTPSHPPSVSTLTPIRTLSLHHCMCGGGYNLDPYCDRTNTHRRDRGHHTTRNLTSTQTHQPCSPGVVLMKWDNNGTASCLTKPPLVHAVGMLERVRANGCP